MKKYIKKALHWTHRTQRQKDMIMFFPSCFPHMSHSEDTHSAV